MTYSPPELVYVCVLVRASRNQNEDPHETCHAGPFPQISLTTWSGAQNPLSDIPEVISHIYIKIFDIILSF